MVEKRAVIGSAERAGARRVFLVDEPTAFLDAEYARDILDLFRTFNQVGVTVLLATHEFVILDPCDGRTPIVVRTIDLDSVRIFSDICRFLRVRGNTNSWMQNVSITIAQP